MGNYPTPPSRRLAYDRDNTQATHWAEGWSGVADLTSGNLQTLNNESDDFINLFTGPVFEATIYVAFLFPQGFKLLDMWLNENYTVSSGGSFTITVEHSDDTTNGRDGTWSTTSTITPVTSPARPGWRNNISSVGAATTHIGYRIKIVFSGGIHVISSYGLINVHMYGPEHGSDNRLAFWKPGSDTELNPDFDFTDIARGATTKIQFRIKNKSGSKTAHAVTVETGEGPSYGTASTYTQLSLDDVTYGNSVSLGDLGPGAISSGTIYLRSQPPTNTELSVMTLRLTPSATGGYS